ncbi:uncharacterized protein LOC111008035 [Momordica charantia]|uniref:Uncharacterized protein LOC111008035 n=1 Tax=Momordica charantia TaxID=3673 RepID=A0A6J1C7B2_MOMCH|nr:uncharacterized protein LOC111008035 [Momordica charantia]
MATHLQISTKMALHSPVLPAPRHHRSPECNHVVSFKPHKRFQNARSMVSCAMNMTAGQSDDPGKVSWDSLKDRVKKLWDSSPEPVKCFPWNEALDNFIQLIADLVLAVIKYLCVPLLAVTSLSEMSYCAHEKKLFVVPFPLIVGFSVAEVMRQTALSLSPILKDLEVPWHLITIAIFFTLIKLPGPYYPYWGRIFIPHFANGGLLRTLWSSFLWFRRPRKPSTQLKHNSTHLNTNKN